MNFVHKVLYETKAGEAFLALLEKFVGLAIVPVESVATETVVLAKEVGK